MKDTEKEKGFLINCYIETGEIICYENRPPLFEAMKDPKSGIEYFVARLDGYKISKIK